MFLTRFIFFVLIGLQSFASDQAVFDKNGFARCFSKSGNTYFFEWDRTIQTSDKPIQYFEQKDYTRATGHHLRSCADYNVLQEIPSSILRNLSEIKNSLPEQVQFSLLQASEGAHLYRTEKTATEYIANRKHIFMPDRPEVLTQLRYETGDRFAAEVLNYFISEIAVQQRSCESLIGSCDFYLCQEQKTPCGLDGYNLSYGYKYCSDSKFKLIHEMKTDLGRRWVPEVFQCLQSRSLQASQQTAKDHNACKKIQDQAYDSHPNCYVQAGFCQLKSSDKQAIYKIIKKEILSTRTLIQAFKTLWQCADQK